MTYKLNVDGSTDTIAPQDGSSFTLDEMQAHVGGGMVEAIGAVTGASGHEVRMYANEDGRLKGMQPNEKASRLAQQLIVGPAVVFTDDDPDDSWKLGYDPPEEYEGAQTTSNGTLIYTVCPICGSDITGITSESIAISGINPDSNEPFDGQDALWAEEEGSFGYDSINCTGDEEHDVGAMTKAFRANGPHASESEEVNRGS